LYMWNLSSVFKCLPFLPICYYVHSIRHCFVCMSGVQYVVQIPGVTIIASNVVYVFFVSGIKCSSCLSNVFHWTIHTFHLVNSTSTIFVSLWLSFNIFCTVFRVRKATFTLMFQKSFVIPLTSFPPYVKVTHFSWCCNSACVFCFCLFCGGFLTKPLSYTLFCSMFLMVFSSMSFTFSVIGYVCNQFNK
jgi:hypothetical protein